MNIVYEKLAAILVTGALAVYCSHIIATPAQQISVERALQTTLTSGQVPPDLVITYYEGGGLWGDETTVIIRGSGRGERRMRKRRNAKPKVYKTTLTQNQLLELIKLVASLKAWERQTPDRNGVPDEGRVNLTINVGGQRSSVSEWFKDMEKNNRLIQIKTKMMELTKSD